MKAIHLIKTVLLLALVASISVRCSCDKTTTAPTTPGSSLGSVRWKVAKATKDGAVQTQKDYENFRVKFDLLDATNGTGTYTVARGGAPFSLSRTSSVGQWTLATAAPTDLKLDTGTPNARTITLSNVTAGKTVTMTWKTEADIDKTTPTIAFDLIPE
jgi:hypothetical protein